MAFTLIGNAAFADAPFDVTNPSFEDSAITAGEADYWTESSDNAESLTYQEGDAGNANFGDDYYQVQNLGGWAVIHTALGQEVAVTPGTDVEMVVWAKTADGSAAAGAVGLKLEFYAMQGEGWVEGGTPFIEEFVDLSAGGYQMLWITGPVPAGMSYARGTIVSTGVAVHVDDVWIGEPSFPCDIVACGTPLGPNPENGSIQSALNAPAYGYLPVTQLSWDFYSPNTLGVRVRFEKEPTGVYDPNWTSGVYTALADDARMVDLSTLTTLPLDDDSLYSWQVETTDGDAVIEGNVWSFQTGDAKPIVQEPLDQYMWLDQEDGDGDPTIRTFTVTTTYTDDGKSAIIDANFTTGDWLWEDGYNGVIKVSNVHTPDTDDPTTGCKSGTVVATYKTVALGDDPARPTEVTTIPGWWNIRLEVTDATDRTTTGDYGYNYIGENCGDATVSEGNGDAGADPDYAALSGPYDANSDCIIDLVDFAAFSAKWLDQSPKFE